MSCFICNKEVGDSRPCPECNILACKAHFQYHNRGGTCAPWRVKNVHGAGRGLFATRKIQAGEVVVQDWAVVEGPLPTSTSICLMCLSHQGCSACPACGLDVCKSRTQGCSARHKTECLLLAKGRKENLTKESLFTCIAAVRLLWACERDPGIRELLDPLLDHREIHRGEGNTGWNHVVVFLTKQGLSEDNVERCLGLLQTNGVTSTSVAGEARGHALYPIFSITNNSCVSNTRHGKRDDVFCLIATTDIEAGEEITTNYKSPTLGNIVRQPAFKSLWNFQCSCVRCLDSTELGTYSSSLLCADCSSAVVQSATTVEEAWTCVQCSRQYTFQFIQEKTRTLQRLVEATGHGVERLENLVTILQRTVYKHHFILMQVKRMLLLMYANCQSHRMEALTPQQIDRKIELCREYIEVFNKLEPGLTKWKARVSEELARALVRKEGRPGVEVCRLIAESNKCRQLDSQEEQAAFNGRVAQLMSG